MRHKWELMIVRYRWDVILTCKLAHVIRYTITITKFSFLLFYSDDLSGNCETDCSFVYLILMRFR